MEEAFANSDRVMTVSIHKYGPKDNMFFPGTGDVVDVGTDRGKYYAVNFPLKDGVTDEQYSEKIFKPIISQCISTFKPTAIVLQCGADSLAGDRLGCFNLTSMAHGACVEFVKGFNLPLLVLGGGGYTVSSVARCWTYETACLLEADISLGKIPDNDYSEYFGPDNSLFVPATGGMMNENSHRDVEKIKNRIFEHLRMVQGAPSVQMKHMPPEMVLEEDDDGGLKPDGKEAEREPGAGGGPARHRNEF